MGELRDTEFYVLGRSVAAYLGTGYYRDRWTATQEYAPTVNLKRPGTMLHIRMRQERGRLWFTGVYPPTDYRAETFRITVSPDRKPEAIAAEIKRRLLPGYEAELAAVVSYNEHAMIEASRRRQMQDMLTSIIPDASVPDHYRDRIFFYGTAGISRGEIHLSHDGSSGDLELRSVPIAVLLQLAAVLAKG